VDVLFVNPGNAEAIYQDLSRDYAAIEPPTWALILAESCRQWGAQVGILDANAEGLSPVEAARRIEAINPRLVCFVTYGQNVNAGIVSMSGAVLIAEQLRALGTSSVISVIGSYVQALPIKALQDEPSFDFVFANEGVYAMRDVLNLRSLESDQLLSVNGLAVRTSPDEIHFTGAGSVVPSSRMDEDMPGYAWDLLPFRDRPFDLYRSPLWHAGYDPAMRTPYAAIQTSLGCNFGCSFCMINIINRSDDAEIGIASNYRGMRFWSPEFALRQFDILADYGVRTIRIVDEMFLLNRKYFVPLCESLSQRPYAPELRMWAYSRIDTIRDPELLGLIRAAGIRWLALGIESASREVRLEVSKGKFEDVDVQQAIHQVHAADIDVMANYIVGLPGDTQESMQMTMDLAVELCTSGWNMYPAMALPGSELYAQALDSGMPVPQDYVEFSFHAYETVPMRTEQLSEAEITLFRDEAFTSYHTNPAVLDRIQARFGPDARQHVLDMASIKLRRRVVDDALSSSGGA
jgi:radical SAM superfamily enzyme YgiQ (UPF0313 family)